MGTIDWPRKRDLFGVRVSETNYEQAENIIIRAASQHVGAVVTHLPVHGVVTGVMNRGYRDAVNQFDLVAPDGQPVRWALKMFYKIRMRDRVYGPELMVRLCRRAEREGVSIYLYGSVPEVVEPLRTKLTELCPGLQIAGTECPPFRPLTAQEEQAMVERINASGAGLVFIGLGLPKQDYFAHQHRDRIHAVQLCVGAAFDFIAGSKRTAPRWMQNYGLEWFFRLTQEPSRLWQRYLTTNTVFLALLGWQLLTRNRRPVV